MLQLTIGIDNFLNDPPIDKGKRIALVTNNAACTHERIRTRIALLKSGFNLVKLFSPEHGLTVAGADGVFQNDHIDSVTNLPVISMYGNYLAPTEEDLNDVDIVLFDIPDVGCRFYTYLWTMTHVMESCASFNKPFMVTDRPNPIGGNMRHVEGPMLDEQNCSSFIGRWTIPIRHCCTLGELANYFGVTKLNSLQFKIIPVINWQRDQMKDGSREKFIPTSPAIRDFTTALLYPGMGLLEGINLNEGRGTNKPFQICGAPWINSFELRDALMKKQCPGISCNPCSYTPSEGLYANQYCNGLEFSITDANDFRPVRTGIALLQTITELYPEHARERLYNTRANPSGQAHLDKLLGVKHAFLKIKMQEPLDTEVADEWNALMQPFLLY